MCACVCIGADGDSIHRVQSGQAVPVKRAYGPVQMLAMPKVRMQFGSLLTTGCERSPAICPSSPGQQSPQTQSADLRWLLAAYARHRHVTRVSQSITFSALLTTFDFSVLHNTFSHRNTKQIDFSVSKKCPTSFSQLPSHEGPLALVVSSLVVSACGTSHHS